MNPQDNTLNPGDIPTGDASSIAPPVDLTGELSSTSNLSMADSLDSAQDNLTSAGMAAADSGPVAMGLDQIGASDPSAQMARPEEPLVPADPVPGSIGSATSGPSLPPAPEAAPVMDPAGSATPSVDMAANPAVAPVMSAQPEAMPTTAPVTPDVNLPDPVANAAPAQPTTLPGTMPVTDGAAVTAAAAAETPSQAPYNPFAPAPGQTSSNNVPTALQPRTEKFSSNGGKDKSKIMTMIFAILSVILATAAIIFAVLWIKAMNEPKIVYVPGDNVGTVEPPSDDVVEPVGELVTCQRVVSPEMEGLVFATEMIDLRFVDNQINNIAFGESLSFENEEYAANQVAALELILSTAQMVLGANTGNGVSVSGNNVGAIYIVAADRLAENISNPDANIAADFPLVVENGQIMNGSRDDLVSAFEGIGYDCAAQE